MKYGGSNHAISVVRPTDWLLTRNTISSSECTRGILYPSMTHSSVSRTPPQPICGGSPHLGLLAMKRISLPSEEMAGENGSSYSVDCSTTFLRLVKERRTIT